MDNVMYVGLARQMTLQRELDVVANNIANSDTVGFKLENLMVHNDPQSLPSTDGGGNILNFPYDSGVARDFSQGALKPTGAPLDVAIQGDGFFKVSTPNGERYTRDGRFAMDGGGKLIDQAGHPVLDASGGEITIDPTLGQVSIGQDGSISQGLQVVGKIGVVKFASQGALSKDGDGLYRNVANIQPDPATDMKVKQGMVESSNVQPVVQITKLIEVSRAYESISQMMSKTADLSSSAIDRLGRVS